jgi:hypothetical protein
MNNAAEFSDQVTVVRFDERTRHAVFSFGIVMATIVWLWLNGAVWWPNKFSEIWSSEVWTSSNSQHPLDPYTLTHTMFGILCFLIASLIAKRSPHSRRFFLAIFAACIWEICENSMFFIERFRHATAAAHYGGDALVNSVTDILACAFGFYLATKIGRRVSILVFITVEVVTMLWVRDNLILNILMLIFSIDSIRNWQMGS